MNKNFLSFWKNTVRGFIFTDINLSYFRLAQTEVCFKAIKPTKRFLKLTFISPIGKGIGI